MAVSAVTEDGQLAPTTVGKPIDMAADGRGDEIDWLNLPWISTEQPSGTEAWQSLTVSNETVEVVESSPDHAEVAVHGSWTESPDLKVTTTYTIEPDQPWVEAETVFTNTGSADLPVWVGDVLDNDGSGQQSYVPGTGVVPGGYGSPDEYSPDQPWIAQTGGEPQVYGLLYTGDATDFTAYGTSAWISSQFQATIPAGDNVTLNRRIVALGTEEDQDRFAAFTRLYEDYLAEQTGLAVDFEMSTTALGVDESAQATAAITNTGDEDLGGVDLTLTTPPNLTTEDETSVTVHVAAGETVEVPWTLTATEGGRSSVQLSATHEGRTLTRRASVFVNGPGWYWGDNHSHSRHSDGSGTIADNFASAAATV